MVLVGERDGETVNFWFGDEFQRGVVEAEETADAGAEFGEILGGKNIVQREHGRGVDDFFEFWRGLGADFGQRLRIAKFRVRGE